MKISDCRIIDLPQVIDPKGNVVFVEGDKTAPFDIKRVFYMFNTPSGITRGGHAHKRLHQLIVAIAGSLDVVVDDGAKKKKVHLDSPKLGFYIPPMIWNELLNFSQDAVCVVFASEHYSSDDYIKSYESFQQMKELRSVKKS
jgi:dTDP-4-dehydrorhamnose 3,5-epimerase-like enzyme